MSPRFWPNQFYKCVGTAFGLCLTTYLSAQTSPITTPDSTKYPGILETLEKLIQIDSEKFQKKNDLLIKSGRNFVDISSVSSLDLDPDFLNSVILHSDPGFIKIAMTGKCRLYDAIINDLLKDARGKVKNVYVTYLNQKKNRESALLTKKEFLSKVVSKECPQTPGLINQFQVKSYGETLNSISFETPTGPEHCHNVYVDWLQNPKTSYLCRIADYIKEARAGQGDSKDLIQRQAVAKILEKKQTIPQRDYLDKLCSNLDDEASFCEEFLDLSFWNKIANGTGNRIFAEDICKQVTGNLNPSELQFKQCLTKLKKESDLCLYPGGRTQGLTPQPQCDSLALALNHSNLRADYRDCPGSSDQQGITNMARVLLNISKDKIGSPNEPCSAVSAGVFTDFNKKYDNDQSLKVEACYKDQMTDKEICYKTFFGSYNNSPNSYNYVVADILKSTRGADRSMKCEMVDSQDYNPMLLQYKSGCYIIYERNRCYFSQCKHKIIYNDRPIDLISIKNRATFDYFPTNIQNEKYSQHYLLTRDYKQTGRSLSNLTSINNFFKKSGSRLIHGVGCAEDLLPSFFKVQAMNHCTPLPFIIDGMLRENDKVTFVTRTGADSLQAPRLISWSSVYSAVKSYQRLHPLRLWMMYGLD